MSTMDNSCHFLGPLNGGQIMLNSLQANRLVAESITAREIGAESILARHIGAGEVTAQHIRAGAITADMITTGFLSADRIRGGRISGVTIDVDTNAVVGESISVGRDIFLRGFGRITNSSSGRWIEFDPGGAIATNGTLSAPSIMLGGQPVATQAWVLQQLATRPPASPTP